MYLIGGPPKCGKTTLAKSLSEATKASWISADTLQNIVKIYTSTADHPKLFPSSSHRTGSNDERFSKYDTQTLIDEYMVQAKSSYPVIEVIVETYLTDEDDFIVEGFQVTPELVDQVHKKFGKEHIKAVFLIRKDAEKFLEDIHKTSTPNDWIIRRTKDEATFPKIGKMVVEYSDLIEQEAAKYDVPVSIMDEHFEDQIHTLTTSIMNGS